MMAVFTNGSSLKSSIHSIIVFIITMMTATHITNNDNICKYSIPSPLFSVMLHKAFSTLILGLLVECLLEFFFLGGGHRIEE